MIRCPSASRKAKASSTSDINPIARTHQPTICQCFRLDSTAETGVENEQKAAMAERYINTHHQLPDQPSAAVSGVSCTMRMPMNSKERVRTATCARGFQTGSALAS